MKIFLIAAIIVVAYAPVVAKAANEEQCQKAVTATLEALEAISEKEGKEAKLKDLSALDIMNLAKEKGVCAASEEISRREK